MPAVIFDSAATALIEDLHVALVYYTLDCTADFESYAQRQALGELVRCDMDNVILLPKDSGKTFLYILTARMPWLGLTVVILPLVALVHDVVVRYSTEQVLYRTWADMDCGSTLPIMGASAPLVFATIEQRVQWCFCLWATRLKVACQLHRVIVDEAHLLLTASNYHTLSACRSWATCC
jgi:hypothetical protein